MATCIDSVPSSEPHCLKFMVWTPYYGARVEVGQNVQLFGVSFTKYSCNAVANVFRSVFLCLSTLTAITPSGQCRSELSTTLLTQLLNLHKLLLNFEQLPVRMIIHHNE